MDKINAKKLYEILVIASQNLNENKDYLNSLNVFPVPDGDTGTNMASTLSEAVKSIPMKETTTVSEVASFVSKGALMGARGNSGVILSQILRGLGNGLKDVDEMTVLDMQRALNSACDSAYKSVMKPKEGTMLTVIKGASESATRNSFKSDIVEFLESVMIDTTEVLKSTKDMLPENKAAGTVDAGGAGLTILLQAFLDVLCGKIDTSTFNFNSGNAVVSNSIIVNDVHPSIENIKFQYCTEFIITSDVDELELRNKFEPLGDSTVVVSMDGITKVHIHTNTPGTVLDVAVSYGDLTRIKIDNMKEQSESNGYIVEESKPKIEQAIISVANGIGIESMLLDSGVTHIIPGGQSMNPSVENIVDAINFVNANNVIVLPNNKNIILSAKQAADIVDCNVYVVNSKTIPQGITAAFSFNGDADFKSNCDAMSDAIDDVKTCLITHAIKDSTMNGITIKKDDILGIVEDKIICTGDSYEEVIKILFENCLDEDTSLVSILYGEDVQDEEVLKIDSNIKDFTEDAEVCFVSGGQSVYPFIISFE